jgi:glycosyltransferase involved in cell wall biosynthesis
VKIAVLTSSYPRFPGDGTAPFVMSISKSFVDQGHEVHVIAPYDPEIRPVDEMGVHIHRFRYIWPSGLHIMGHARALKADVKLDPLTYFLIPFYFCAAFLHLFFIAYRMKCEIIHVHWVLPNGPIATLAASCLRIPFVVSLHGSDIYLSKKNILFKILAGYVFRRASGVTACSKELQKAAIELGAAEKTHLIPWGADPVIFSPLSNDPKVRERFGILPSELLLVAIGRMVHKKGFENLLSAMQTIVKEHPEIKLILGGDGPLLDDFVHQTARLNLSENIKFAGRIPWDEIPNFLATADIFVLPSIRDEYGNVDGLPTVLLEAMSSGVAVVASNIGGVELVLDHNKNGVLIPPGDVNALSDAIQKLINNPDYRTTLAANARTSVMNQFNWSNITIRLLNLFEMSIWYSQQDFRLGTIYRQEVLEILDKKPADGKVLDVGCFDGYWLSTLKPLVRIGVDPNPKSGVPNITMVCADGNHLPFKDLYFDTVFVLDVIEHIEDDQEFANSLTRMIAPGGKLILTTPSSKIQLFPPFLTRWISNQWGHNLRLGYNSERLIELFSKHLQVNLLPWNAPAYRYLYLPVRILALIAPRLASRIVRRFARWDFNHSLGDKGFYILEGIPISEQHLR